MEPHETTSVIWFSSMTVVLREKPWAAKLGRGSRNNDVIDELNSQEITTMKTPWWEGIEVDDRLYTGRKASSREIASHEFKIYCSLVSNQSVNVGKFVRKFSAANWCGSHKPPWSPNHSFEKDTRNPPCDCLIKSTSRHEALPPRLWVEESWAFAQARNWMKCFHQQQASQSDR